VTTDHTTDRSIQVTTDQVPIVDEALVTKSYVVTHVSFHPTAASMLRLVQSSTDDTRSGEATHRSPSATTPYPCDVRSSVWHPHVETIDRCTNCHWSTMAFRQSSDENPVTLKITASNRPEDRSRWRAGLLVCIAETPDGCSHTSGIDPYPHRRVSALR
jgi:hypothetical protein